MTTTRAAVTAGAMASASLAAVVWLGGPAPVARAGDPRAWLLLALLGSSAVVARVVDGRAARRRTRDGAVSVAVMVAAVLVLPPLGAFAVTLLASAVASARRRPRGELLVDLGREAVAVAALAAVGRVAGAGTDTVAGAAGVALAALTFAAVDLAGAALLRPEAAHRRLPVPAGGWQLAAGAVLGQAGAGALVVSLARHSPGLLPVVALPLLALRRADELAAEAAETGRRSHHLGQLGRAVLDGSSTADAISGAAETVRSAFRAAGVRVVLRGAPAVSVGQLYGQAVAVRVGSGDGVLELHGAHVREDDPLLLAVAQTVGAAGRSLLAVDALRAETAKLQDVIDHASDAIVVLDGRGRVTVWSPAAVELTGRSADDVRRAQLSGTPLLALGELLGCVLPLAALAPERPQVELGVAVRRPDGQARDVRVSASGRFDDQGRLTRVVLLGHDVTRDRRLDRMKDDFVATVSHELRTPLTPIKGYARLLAVQGDRFTDERRSQVLELIEERADHLSQLVDDLLVASRIRADGPAALPVTLGEHDVVDLVRRAVTGIPGLADRLRLDVPDAPLAASCDPVRLTQCLTNLVSNALKYSPAGTPVEIGVRAGLDTVALEVADHGAGIPADELERVFERFHRVEDAMTARTSGSGLGLYIARELARAMGGDITVESTPGVGSRFRITVRRTADLAETA